MVFVFMLGELGDGTKLDMVFQDGRAAVKPMLFHYAIHSTWFCCYETMNLFA
jgi:hypothetical protein